MIKPEITIVIATYNSTNTLPLVLNSIVNQKISKGQTEILVIDGGSKDNTREIAKSYGAAIIDNPKVEQNYAKYLGFKNAKGNYLIYLDSDEVLVNIDSLKNRLKIFKQNRNVKMLVGNGYINPKKSPFIVKYINEFGDPFSYFLYRLSKNSKYFLPAMCQRFLPVVNKSDYLIFALTGKYINTIFELTAGGSMFDRKYFLQHYPALAADTYLLNHAFYLIAERQPFIAVTKNDEILHLTTTDIRSYLNKIKWRIKNNVFYDDTMGKSVYTGREKITGGNKLYLKYLFIPYSLFIVLPLIDAIYLAISRKDINYLFHVVLCLYTSVIIVSYVLLKTLGYKPTLSTYGTNHKIK